MDQIELERYIYKLIPDYAYIDYAENEYWTHHTSPSDPLAKYDNESNGWFEIVNILFNIDASDNETNNNNNKFKDVSYGRCLMISPVELEFNNHVDEIICQLKKYGKRYVYACFSSDDEILKCDFEVRGKTNKVIEYAQYDNPYVFVLRF